MTAITVSADKEASDFPPDALHMQGKEELDDQVCGLRSHLADRKAKRNTQLVVRQQKKQKQEKARRRNDQ